MSIYELLSIFKKHLEENPDKDLYQENMHICFKLKRRAKKSKKKEKIRKNNEKKGFV
jgi:hypothetical protein